MTAPQKNSIFLYVKKWEITVIQDIAQVIWLIFVQNLSKRDWRVLRIHIFLNTYIFLNIPKYIYIPKYIHIYEFYINWRRKETMNLKGSREGYIGVGMEEREGREERHII